MINQYRPVKKRVKEFVPGHQMTADEYILQWRKGKAWEHLTRPVHQKRLNWCSDQCLGESFLDVGCAFGHSTAIMKTRHPGKWFGVDFSVMAIAEALALFPDIQFSYLKEIWEIMNLTIFDSVVCSEVIEHVPDPSALLAAMTTIARKRIIITTPTRDAQDPGHVRLYDLASLEVLLKDYPHTISMDENFFYATVEMSRCEY
ncbi:MAG: methyltransferase domain-containing protein [Dehalococcoidia bacterium]|jgi:2-polyprenyl-3-methyl-5-hydroxy-6-metoxy-1,4-benzoquinol methylase